MKNLLSFFVLVFVASSFTSCGEECYLCSQDSYWNGIVYTEEGQEAWYCKEEGETDEQYEARIEKKAGYTCRKSRR